MTFVAAPSPWGAASAELLIVALSRDELTDVVPADGAEPAPAGCGVRKESRATTIVIAAASTASAASWPPIRRGSSGSADEVTPASLRLLCRSGLPPLCDGLGVTTGNRLDRLPGETVVVG